MNEGGGQASGSGPIKRPAHFTSYKLISDPFLSKGVQRIYRYDGVVPDDPTHPEVRPQDPRSRHKYSSFWGRLDVSEYPRLRFKIDSHYVGEPPPVEVTITNVNDNADKTFLLELLQKFGPIEELHVYYHPVTKLHLGLARVIFELEKSAKACVEKLNKSPVMGKILDVFFDPLGNTCKELFEKGTTDSTVSVTPHCIEPQPEPEPIPVYKEPKECPSPKMDLDTRIKMMFTGRSADDFGKLLGFTSNSDDESTNPISGVFNSRKRGRASAESNTHKWDSDDDSSNYRHSSPPPSPFLASEKENSSGLHKFSKRPNLKVSDFEKDLDQISDDSGDIGSNPTNCKRDVDDMSLSSLSPEDTSFIKLPPTDPLELIPTPGSSDLTPLPSQLPILPILPTKEAIPPPLPPSDPEPIPPPPSLPPPSYPPPNHFFSLSALPPLYHHQQLPYQPNYVYPSWNNEHYEHSLGMTYPPLPYGFPPDYIDNVQPPTPPKPPSESEEESEEQTNARIVKIIVEKLMDDMKIALRRDFQRKMVEGVGYRFFEDWFSEIEKQNKVKLDMVKITVTMPPNETPESYKRARASQNSSSSSFTLGFRATIPKLPSFRKKAPTPPPVYRATRKSLEDSDEDRSKYGDSDVDVRKRRKVRRSNLRLSSESESSSEVSSSEESDSTILSSSASRAVRKQKEIVQPKSSANSEALLKPVSISDVSDFQFSPDVAPETLKMSDPELEVLPSVEVQNQDQADKENESPIKVPREPERPDPKVCALDHNYAKIIDETSTPMEVEIIVPETRPESPPAPVVEKKRRGRKPKVVVPPPVKAPAVKVVVKNGFAVRTEAQETDVMTEFLRKGVDAEDLVYMKTIFELMISDDQGYWLKSSHWVDHPMTYTPPSPVGRKPLKRIHLTGCARSEGKYNLTAEEKTKQKQQWGSREALGTAGAMRFIPSTERGGKQQTLSREARSNQRRLLTALGNEVDSDLLKFNQLKFRKKNLRFGRSRIHDWGLFAAEPIAADEMVIEYVGQMIRPSVADHRERQYEKVGIGSSYLFRIDYDNIIDATKCGNLSRFINHCCTPNCYAKIITIEGRKKIVIYSKQQIALDEEITYDYKFPIEEEKIRCLCCSPGCRGTLN